MQIVEKVVKARAQQKGELKQSCAWKDFLTVIDLQFLYIWEDMCIDAQRLEDSLSATLDLYPAIAGRVANRGALSSDTGGLRHWTIEFTNDGVPFKVLTDFEGSIRDVPSGEDGPPLGMYADYPAQGATSGGPLLTVKLTCFREGGCILGLVANHAVFDGWTFASFMRDWSAVHGDQMVLPSINDTPEDVLRCASEEEVDEIVKTEDMELMMPAWLVKVMKPLGMAMMRRAMRSVDQKRCIIHFSDIELQALKAKAQASAGTWVSTNEALLAHMYPLMLDVFEVKRTKAGVGMPVNLRGKLKTHSERLVGNHLGSAWFSFDVPTDEKTSWSGCVHEGLRAKLTEANLVKKVQFGNATDPENKFYMPKDVKTGGPGLLTQWNYQVSSPYHEVEFGVGKPTRSQPWVGEPVKVMKGLHGGVDVMIYRGASGPAEWAKDKNAAAGKCVLFSQFMLLCGMWRYRNALTRRRASVAILFLALSTMIRKTLKNFHSKYVESCFTRLKTHPQLRAFMHPGAAARRGGA